MAYDRQLEADVDDLISRREQMGKKRMFGGVCYLVNDNMAFGILNDGIIVRAGTEQADRML